MKPHEKIAAALERVKRQANKHGAHIIRSNDINRDDRELLVRTSWLQEITRGWYMLTRPDLAVGDSAAWHANFWDFLRIYLSERYGTEYCLSAEISLELHIGTSIIPKQVIVVVKQGGTKLDLPFGTSILTYSDEKNLPEQYDTIHGLQVMPLALALCKITPTYFREKSENVEIALRSISNPGNITRYILEHDFLRAANRIIGAYQFLGMEKTSKEMINLLATSGKLTTPTNPFLRKKPLLISERFRSPHAARIEALWQKYRQPVIDQFPKAPGLPKNPEQYMSTLDELYQYDAYNSLSIEGYQVTEDLINQVQKRDWNPDTNREDKNTRDALAARGYYEAYQVVKESVYKILHGGASPGQIINDDLAIWYQNLFAPSVRANIIPASGLAGYRNDQVYIRNSRHVPLPKEALIDAMETFFNCLKNETHPAVRAILGHYIFVFIHPYMDGNGRIARFLMNTQLASGGYPWTIVEFKRRRTYIDSIESTHTEQNIEAFAKLIVDEMKISKSYLNTK